MRVVERPAGIVAGGKGFRIFDAEAEVADTSTTTKVRESLNFALCDEAGQRMLLAVASVASEDGIHAGDVDPATGIPRGASVAELALRAGLPREVAQTRLRWLCQEGMLFSFEVPFGTVLILPDYEERNGIWGCNDEH